MLHKPRGLSKHPTLRMGITFSFITRYPNAVFLIISGEQFVFQAEKRVREDSNNVRYSWNSVQLVSRSVAGVNEHVLPVSTARLIQEIPTGRAH